MSLPRRRPGVRRLAKRGDVAGLAEALRWRDLVQDAEGRIVDLGIPIRLNAVSALAGLEDGRAVAALREATDDRALEIRLEAVRALRLRALRRRSGPGPLRALAAAVAALPPGDPAREEAADALVEAGDAEVAERFATALARTDRVLQPEDHRLLECLVGGAANGAAERVVGALLDVAHRGEGPARERSTEIMAGLVPAGSGTMIEAVGDEDAERSWQAIELVGLCQDPNAVDPLVKALSDLERPPGLRAAAARALGRLKDPRGMKPLMGATLDSEYVVRIAATEALDRFGATAVIFGIAALMRSLAAGDGAAADGLLLTAPDDADPGEWDDEGVAHWVGHLLERYRRRD